MGLIKAGLGAVGGALADQWLEYFYCEAMPPDVLVRKGQKRTSNRSSNTKGSDNIISQGSVIAVADGQCIIIVEQGLVVDICAEPGEYKYDRNTQPSIFTGNLSGSIPAVIQEMWQRLKFGGQAAMDQRVYYFNTKEIIGNKYGTPAPVPFRVVDKNVGLDVDIAIRCFGEYSYRVINPPLFYANVCGNVEAEYKRTMLDDQLKTELMTALQPAFARISAMGIRYSELPGRTTELADALNAELSNKWANLRGIAVVSFGVSSVTANEEDEKMIKELQRNAAFRDPTMAAAHLVGAQAQAMQSAASNEGGAAVAFMGMNMAQGAGGMNAQDLYAMGQQQQAQQQQAAAAAAAAAAAVAPVAPAPVVPGWTCSCGSVNAGKFCMDCGKAKPQDVPGWTCSCGTLNKGKFCSECAAPKPAGVPQYKCDKCGWEPENPANPPKFCPECADPFDDGDVV